MENPYAVWREKCRKASRTPVYTRHLAHTLDIGEEQTRQALCGQWRPKTVSVALRHEKYTDGGLNALDILRWSLEEEREYWDDIAS